MIRRRHALLALVLAGCGSSSEPARPSIAEAPAPPSTKPVETSKPPVRTLKTVGLFGGTSVSNLLLDPTFGDGEFGIGRWLSNSATAVDASGPALSQLVTADAPVGISLPVGAVGDAAAPKAFSLLAQVPGGSGPYRVKLWLATEAPYVGTAPLESVVRVSFAGATAGGLTGVDVPIDPAAARTLAGRTWNLYQADVPGPFTLGGFLVLRFKGSKNRWWLQAPEVVPAKLAEALPETKALLAKPKVRAIEDDELRAIERYRRMPLRYGLGAPR